MIFTKYHLTDLFAVIAIHSKIGRNIHWNVLTYFLCTHAVSEIIFSEMPISDSNISIIQVLNYEANSPICPVHVLASYQICKIADCAYAGNAGNVFTATYFKENP